MAKLDEMTKAELIAREKRRLSRARSGGGGGGGSGLKIGARLKRLGRTAEKLGVLYGTTNPPITIATGRNLLNPTGNLQNTPRSNGQTLDLVNPHTGARTPQTAVMLDIVGHLSGAVGQFQGAPDNKFGTRFKGAFAKIRYNAVSSITPGGGFATTWWPVVLGPLAGTATRMLLDTGADVARDLRGLVKR